MERSRAVRVTDAAARADGGEREAGETTPARTTWRPGRTAGPPSEDAVRLLSATAGNAAVQRLLSGNQAPGTAAPGEVPAGVLPAPGTGEVLPSTQRAFFEPRLGADLSAVRIHRDATAARAAESLGASAFTAGSDIVFGAGAYDPGSTRGQLTLAHELTHVAQGQHGTTSRPGVSDPHEPAEREAGAVAAAVVRGAPAQQVAEPASAQVHRQPTDPNGPAPPPPPSADLQAEEIPKAWTHPPAGNSLLVARLGDQMVALPATGSMLLVQAPAGAAAPTTAATPDVAHGPLVAVPTVAKESVKMVNVGGNAGFLVDAGGEQAVLLPSALAAMSQALGTTTISGMVITHIHSDHVRSVVELIRTGRIPPEHLHFPEAFRTNAGAPSSMFAQALRTAEADADLQALGYGPSAAYAAIQTPTEGSYFRVPVSVGAVDFEYFGITEAFRVMAQHRAAGQPQTSAQVQGQRVPSLADTASLLTRVTHRATGFRVLFLSDLRFSDLGLFRAAMGDTAYGEMLSQVRVVEGIGHHIGALETQADRDNLVEFLQATQLRSGNLVVMAQSQESYGGRQFLNRSMIEALRHAGIDVHVALEPSGDAAGTFTVGTDGQVTYSGPGRAESFAGEQAVRDQISRLNRLRETEDILTRYERFVNQPYRRSAEVRAAREALERELADYLGTTVDNIQRGAAGRASGALRDPAAQAAALTRVERTRQPVEDVFTPAVMDTLRELREQGPQRELLEREFAEAQRTGRLSEAGIEALWDLEPEVARQLVGESGMSARARQRAMAQLPGAPASGGTRLVAGVLLAVEIVNLVGPIIAQERQRRKDSDVGQALDDIIWWQEKHIQPLMEAVNDRWWPRSNVWETDPAKIKAMLDADDCDFLSLTGLPDDRWPLFMIWASSHIENFRDWDQFILSAVRAGRLRCSGQYVQDLTWEYRTTHVHGTWSGHEITTEWRRSDDLDRILQASARAMVTASEQQLGERASQPGELSGGGAVASRGGVHRSPGLFERKPQATGRRRFRAGTTEPTLYTLAHQYERTGYSADDVFYVFTPEASQEDVPSGYVVVGGANYNTYTEIYATRNIVLLHNADGYGGTLDLTLQPNTEEVLLAKAADLEEVR